MGLRVRELSKRYGKIAAVERVSLTLEDGSSAAILGPSGCGKSTLLRLVAGLETPDHGSVYLDRRDVTGQPAHRRNVGMVFQDFALFPHLDVAGNVAFALVEAGWPAARRRARVSELLELVGMAGSEKRRTFELSGGQQQRVALARALAARPRLLLLDEPLSDLDPGLRSSLQEELRRIIEDAGVQALYVTHDRTEALSVAPLLAVMREGAIVQAAPGSELLERPASAWLARFLGYRNVFSASDLPHHFSGAEAVLIRDDLISLDGDKDAEIVAVNRTGPRLQLRLLVDDWGVELHWQGYARELAAHPVAGERVRLRIPESAWLPLSQDGEAVPGAVAAEFPTDGERRDEER